MIIIYINYPVYPNMIDLIKTNDFASIVIYYPPLIVEYDILLHQYVCIHIP